MSLMFMVPLALANATSTLVAQCIGANDPRDARRLGWRGLQLGVGIAAAMGGSVYLLRETILRGYTHDAVIERPDQTIVGRDAIAEYFRGVPARLAGARVTFESVDVHDPEHVTFNWRLVGGPADGTAGADTVVLRSGRIAHQRVRLAAGDF